ncbi:hydrolase 1, exosortase A system-associated [Mitsuaria sp. WAJ17]|uniref:hydrolase 1, exosortase A system-associated n=1 Tax=Mitsuaria sp. WAJ17 TaxID=2761452 RepID=UPI0016025A58|nr:hydrolase 1, exosortase A system-associated [Mitsuaria sp. WAJ17]MBB2486234.1 hydrolase 1, exosortase A system-associated [Mitsuaria sp. WAJ17]
MSGHTSVIEQVCPVSCEGLSLPGILSLPPAGRPRLGVIVVVGGPQYRIGAHRFFVSLARQMAGHGAAVLRFDHRGMGDALGLPPGFEHLDPEIDAAIAALQQACPTVDRVLLWGLCDGASAALLHARRGDARVAGLLLANPWVRSEHSLAQARTRHYYPARLASADFWRRLLSGQVRWSSLRTALGALGGSLRRSAAANGEPGTDFRAGMREGLAHFQGRVLCLLSGADLTAQEFSETLREPGWAALASRPGFSLQWLDGADHTFSDPEHRAAALNLSAQWLQDFQAPVATPSASPAADPAVI